MSRHYEVITGWLVLKTFFNWIESETNKETVDNNAPSLVEYNSFIIGTLLSLLLGIGVGLCAKFALCYLTKL